MNSDRTFEGTKSSHAGGLATERQHDAEWQKCSRFKLLILFANCATKVMYKSFFHFCSAEKRAMVAAREKHISTLKQTFLARDTRDKNQNQ